MSILAQKTIDDIRTHQAQVLASWGENLAAAGANLDARISASEVAQQTREFLNLVVEASASSDGSNMQGKSWLDTRKFLEDLSRSRARQGFDSHQTANFIFSLKRPLFDLLRNTYADNAVDLANQSWTISEMLDNLGMYKITAFQKSREEVINRQQEELLELSTPVVKLWDGILALPMIGTLDSQRTQIAMEALLQRIVDTGSEIAIIDITGVPTVDTLVAQHLLKTVTAIRLMGADAIISGVRPQIAQTIVHLGLDLQGIATKSNLADALAMALKRAGLVVTKAS
jgi:rsbT co-antagonist protein RsbR